MEKAIVIAPAADELHEAWEGALAVHQLKRTVVLPSIKEEDGRGDVQHVCRIFLRLLASLLAIFSFLFFLIKIGLWYIGSVQWSYWSWFHAWTERQIKICDRMGYEIVEVKGTATIPAKAHAPSAGAHNSGAL